MRSASNRFRAVVAGSRNVPNDEADQGKKKYHQGPKQLFNGLRRTLQNHDNGLDIRFDLICRKLRLNPADRLVEIGPVWGFMPMLAVEKYGADLTSYGLVPSQNDDVCRLMVARNFSGKLRLVERDHRELANEPARYDRFVSIGMHEQAGRDWNEQWIRSIAAGSPVDQLRL